MNRLYDIIRLVMTSTLSDRDIAASLAVAKNTVSRYRHLVKEHGYRWEELSELTPAALDARFNKTDRRLVHKRMPDFTAVHQELQEKGVTLLLLWEEYRAAGPEDALSYSQFTHHYRQFTRTVSLSMRQSHLPGDRVFVDFSGKRPSFVDQRTGEQVHAELFIAALGYSHLLFARAVPSQSLGDWIGAHIAMFNYFGGVPSVIVPDNLRSAVSKPGREPTLNRSYEDMARHYGVVIIPARSRHPKDKGKVEVAVQVAQRWILARLRHRTFFSLAELNKAVGELLQQLNERPFKRIPGCRRQRFEQHERAALRPLPNHPYEFAEWSTGQRVGLSYHVLVQGHWYSVPHELVNQTVEARVTSMVVELFHAYQRIASHPRSNEKGGSTTNPAHMSDAHKAQADRTPERYIDWGRSVGPNLMAVVQHQFEREFPALGLPACDALRRLARQYGPERLEKAAKRAVEIQSLTVKSVKSLLSLGARMELSDLTPVQGSLPLHCNLRGASYYGDREDSSC